MNRKTFWREAIQFQTIDITQLKRVQLAGEFYCTLLNIFSMLNINKLQVFVDKKQQWLGRRGWLCTFVKCSVAPPWKLKIKNLIVTRAWRLLLFKQIQDLYCDSEYIMQNWLFDSIFRNQPLKQPVAQWDNPSLSDIPSQNFWYFIFCEWGCIQIWKPNNS